MTNRLPEPDFRLAEEDLRTIEAMRGILLEREEVRFLPPLAASLIDNEVPLLVAEIRRLRGELGTGR